MTLTERLAAYHEEWGWYEADDERQAGHGHHMAQMLYRLPLDAQTRDMQASIEGMLADLGTLAARLAERDHTLTNIRAALLPMRRYMESAAITDRALGKEGREWLDLLTLMDRVDAALNRVVLDGQAPTQATEGERGWEAWARNRPTPHGGHA